LVALVVGAALSMGSSSAWALAYTLAAPVAFNNVTLGISGTLNPVTLGGTSICLLGSCTNAGAQDWLLVSVTLNGGSAAVDRIDMSAAGVATVVGLGHFSDPGTTPTASSTLPSASIARFDYGDPFVSALNLQPGQTTDRLFAAFSPLGSLPGPGIFPIYPPGTASITLSKAGGSNFSVQGSIVLVPEPGTLLLLGGGALGLGLAGRRRL